MDFSRCVVIHIREHVWENILPYLFKKREKYNWIVNKSMDLQKSPDNKIAVYIWWDGDKEFSATPLRSHLKRIKQKAVSDVRKVTGYAKKCAECFKISRNIVTKRILQPLMLSADTHEWDGSYISKELSEYLGAVVKKTPKQVTLKFEVDGQQSEPPQSMEVVHSEGVPHPPPPPSTPQKSGPQPTTHHKANPRQQTHHNRVHHK